MIDRPTPARRSACHIIAEALEMAAHPKEDTLKVMITHA